MADLILTEATVASIGGTTTTTGTKCCTKTRAEALNCTVTAPTGAVSNQLITGAKRSGKTATTAPTLTAGGTTTYTGTTYYAKAASASSNPAGKIYYGASSGATTYNITASTTATNLSSMGRADVGTTTIYAFFRPTDTTNYSDSSVASTTVKITNKATGSSGSVSNPAALTYKTSATYSYQLGITGATGTVTYPTSITVKNGSTTISGWTCTSAGVVTVPANTNAASYTVTGNITVAAATNYNAVSATSKTWTITISKATGSASVSGVTKTYNPGVAYDLISVSSNTGTMHYRLGTSGSWTTTKPGTGQAGTYTVYYYMDATTNYTARGSSSSPWGSVSSTINKATGSVTVTGLHPTSSPGTLVSVSNQNTGTMHYKVNSGSWSTSIPATTTAGAYTVYYYSDASTNYTAVGSKSSPKSVKASYGAVLSGPESITTTSSSGTYGFTSQVSGSYSAVTTSKSGIVSSASASLSSGVNGTVSFTLSGSGTGYVTLTLTATGKTFTTKINK